MKYALIERDGATEDFFDVRAFLADECRSIDDLAGVVCTDGDRAAVTLGLGVELNDGKRVGSTIRFEVYPVSGAFDGFLFRD